jgi:hypothetical protein
MAALGHLVASALRQVATAVPGDHWTDFRPVPVKFGGVGNDVLDDQIGWHAMSPLQDDTVQCAVVNTPRDRVRKAYAA